MIVKVLQNKDELFHPVTGLMCYWVTDKLFTFIHLILL